nr:protein phosphatase 1 regulatory subunit 12 [Halisarca dujardinii]
MPQWSDGGLETMSKNTEINLSFGRTDTARVGRVKQLERWSKSDVAKESGTERKHRKRRKIKFQDNVVFHSAVISGDRDEVEKLLKEGYDVNCINDDGLTGLHQSCIEEDTDMVLMLLDHRANVNATDFEGWSPLHAAASCGYEGICRLLLVHGADPSAVNNEGNTAMEQALEQDDEVIADIIQKEIEKQGISIEEVKGREQRLLMQEALELKNNSTLEYTLSTQEATPLHVAAAKGYLDVLGILLKARKSMLDSLDRDGWSPLHAAVYWGEFAAAEMLVLHGADFTATTTLGKTVEDLANEDDAEQMEQLKKLAGTTQQGWINKQRNLRTSSSSDVKPSPQAMRRRLSKELSRESLKMDMKNEKRTLENAPNNIAEEMEPSVSPNLPTAEHKEAIAQLIREDGERTKDLEKEPPEGVPESTPNSDVVPSSSEPSETNAEHSPTSLSETITEGQPRSTAEENTVVFSSADSSSSSSRKNSQDSLKESLDKDIKDVAAASQQDNNEQNNNVEPSATTDQHEKDKASTNGSEFVPFRPRAGGMGSLPRKASKSGSVLSMIQQLEGKIEIEGTVVLRPKSESFSGTIPVKATSSAGAPSPATTRSVTIGTAKTGSSSTPDIKRYPFQAKTIAGAAGSKTSPIATRKTNATPVAVSPSAPRKHESPASVPAQSPVVGTPKSGSSSSSGSKHEAVSSTARTEHRISVTTKAVGSASGTTKTASATPFVGRAAGPNSTASSSKSASPIVSPGGSPRPDLKRRSSARSKITQTLDGLMKGRKPSMGSSSSEPDKDSHMSRSTSVDTDVFRDSENASNTSLTQSTVATKVPTGSPPATATSSGSVDSISKPSFSGQNGVTSALPADVPQARTDGSGPTAPSQTMSTSSSISSNISTPSTAVADLSVARGSSRDDSQRSEMVRKKRVRKELKVRKATQGVSQEDFRKLMGSSEDDFPKNKSEESAGESPLISRKETDLDTTYDADSSIFETPPQCASKNHTSQTLDSSLPENSTDDLSLSLSGQFSEKASPPPVCAMSAYKPSSRPQPKLNLDTLDSVQNPGALWNTPEMDRRKHVKTDGEPSSKDTLVIVKEERLGENPREEREVGTPEVVVRSEAKEPTPVDDSLLTADPSNQDDFRFLSPNERGRAKSVARRKKKEKRRSTGIKFSDEDDSITEGELPEELQKLVSKDKSKKKKKKQEELPEVEAVKNGDPSKEVKALQQRIAELEQALQSEQDKLQELNQINEEWVEKAQQAEKLNAEMTKKCEDSASSLAKQEKETVKLKANMSKLEEELANAEGKKSENQRLKDENKALIRVIAKMSRAPGVNTA